MPTQPSSNTPANPLPFDFSFTGYNESAVLSDEYQEELITKAQEQSFGLPDGHSDLYINGRLFLKSMDGYNLALPRLTSSYRGNPRMLPVPPLDDVPASQLTIIDTGFTFEAAKAQRLWGWFGYNYLNPSSFASAASTQRLYNLLELHAGLLVPTKAGSLFDFRNLSMSIDTDHDSVVPDKSQRTPSREIRFSYPGAKEPVWLNAGLLILRLTNYVGYGRTPIGNQFTIASEWFDSIRAELVRGGLFEE